MRGLTFKLRNLVKTLVRLNVIIYESKRRFNTIDDERSVNYVISGGNNMIRW